MSISFEKQVGTIEQLIIKPYPFWLILTVKTYVVLLITALKGVLLFAIIRITLPISLVFNINLVWILLVSVIGFTGVGLALSGLTMKFAKTASFESIISYGLLFFSGTIIPFDKMPSTVQRILDAIPFTAGINASQKLLNGNSQVLQVLLWLVFINLACFMIGYWIFNAFFRNVKTNGVLNNY
jgi:ABC-2 type transport system permease protein